MATLLLLSMKRTRHHHRILYVFSQYTVKPPKAAQRAQIVGLDASSPKPSGQLRRTTKESVTFVGHTRQQQALNKARSSSATFDQCCYVEWCADFHPVHYMKALEELLGEGSVYQLMKMSGHVMVGLASMVENGLTNNNTFLRAFPYRRKAEKIILGNLPIAVREEDIIEALRPYCRVVSLAYEVVSCNGYTWTTGNREAFDLLNEGRKLHQLPAKLVIISKGESTHAYITYVVRCSRCHLQGHRRATCSQGTRSGPHFSGDGEDHHQPSAWNRQAVDELGGSRRSGESTPHEGGNRRLHQGGTKEKEAGGLRSGRTESQEGLRPGSRHEANPHPAPRSKVQECTSTRQKQALFRARSAVGKVDQCVYLEFCPDFSQAQYFLALEAKQGKGTVYQLAKMEGQILVGLSSVQLADRLVEEGFDIEDAILRAFPLRKRAERIVLGNIFFFVEDADLVAALRPYGQVTSIVQKWMELDDSYWADSRREAFITLRDGVKLSQIPARLDVKSKGLATHVYVTYGIKCSLCNRQGDKRANCPRKTGLQERHLLLPVDAPLVPTAIPSKPPSNSNAPPPPVAAPPPAAAVVTDSPSSDAVRTKEAADLTSPTPENRC
ncbi:hypothetical protein LAZ67_8002832 [Cordylochernes scorpioides]|uniref:Gag-like protein n=1 Tax=Cordylochernes scorpioides TaxID=51811 RepID=A0ABY6KRT8_9ARAC|nr:hypothetical protein LAZ67_8002832 [Cordylochernes scorpioides]